MKQNNAGEGAAPGKKPKMEIEQAEFITSAAEAEHMPAEKFPEFAFAGRSNVGKSSLINMLTGRKNLAHTSGKPGKTQTINFFEINNSWYLVDLPGYGYAQRSKSIRKKWDALIYNYLKSRMALECVFLLIDSRIPPQKSDIAFANVMGELSVPFVLVFTKTDKPKEHELQQNIKAFQQEMLQYWNELPNIFITSANKNTGREEILSFIENVRSEER